jgi:hypothetical protein
MEVVVNEGVQNERDQGDGEILVRKWDERSSVAMKIEFERRVEKVCAISSGGNFLKEENSNPLPLI